MPRYLTARDIADAIERDPRTVRRWVRAGRLPPRLAGIGGEVPRWEASAVAAALRAGGYAVPEGWEAPPLAVAS